MTATEARKYLKQAGLRLEVTKEADGWRYVVLTAEGLVSAGGWTRGTKGAAIIAAANDVQFRSGDVDSPPASKLEVHEHCYIAGPNTNRGMRLVHSHEGGDKPHVHKDAAHETGCGSYTIDKDEWYARTGLRGGGRKKFTAKATGQQLPLVPIDPPEIKIVIVGDGGASVAKGATGAGLDPIHRMQLACKSRVVSVTHIPGPGPIKATRSA